MTGAAARELALDWVIRSWASAEGYRGALLIGSVHRRPPEEELDEGSDLDVWIVAEDAAIDGIRGRKTELAGLVLEPSLLPASRFSDAEAVLADYVIACHVAEGRALHDPLGFLAALGLEVRRGYAEPRWVLARCRRALDYLAGLRREWAASGSPARLFMLLLAQLWTLAQVPALAALRDPTVRRCLSVSAELLGRAGRPGLQSELQALAGIASGPDLRLLFEAAEASIELGIASCRTPFPGDGNVCAASLSLFRRAVPAMAGAGEWPAARFWCLLQMGFSQIAVELDGDAESRAAAAAALSGALSALGIGSPADLRARVARGAALEGRIMEAALRIMDDRRP